MDILENPFAVFIISAAAQWLAAYAGDFLRNRGYALGADDREDFNLVRNAALTLLALIIGFSLSMAVTRYDQRKNYEEAEANAVDYAISANFQGEPPLCQEPGSSGGRRSDTDGVSPKSAR